MDSINTSNHTLAETPFIPALDKGLRSKVDSKDVLQEILTLKAGINTFIITAILFKLIGVI